MGKEYRLDKGFLFDKNWESSMRLLSAKKFYELFWALYDYQDSKGEKKVPAYPKNSTMYAIATLILPQIKHRLDGAKGGGAHTTPHTAPFRIGKDEW